MLLHRFHFIFSPFQMSPDKRDSQNLTREFIKVLSCQIARFVRKLKAQSFRKLKWLGMTNRRDNYVRSNKLLRSTRLDIHNSEKKVCLILITFFQAKFDLISITTIDSHELFVHFCALYYICNNSCVCSLPFSVMH